MAEGGLGKTLVKFNYFLKFRIYSNDGQWKHIGNSARQTCAKIVIRAYMLAIPWTVMSGNFADPLWALHRKQLKLHSCTHGIKDLAGVEGRQMCGVAMRSVHWQPWMPVAEDHQV